MLGRLQKVCRAQGRLSGFVFSGDGEIRTGHHFKWQGVWLVSSTETDRNTWYLTYLDF